MKKTLSNTSLKWAKGHKTIKRTYKGKEYVVKVTKEGFKMGAKLFASLGGVASEIAGWHNMDGPRFFGLRPSPAKSK